MYPEAAVFLSFFLFNVCFSYLFAPSFVSFGEAVFLCFVRFFEPGSRYGAQAGLNLLQSAYRVLDCQACAPTWTRLPPLLLAGRKPSFPQESLRPIPSAGGCRTSILLGHLPVSPGRLPLPSAAQALSAATTTAQPPLQASPLRACSCPCLPDRAQQGTQIWSFEGCRRGQEGVQAFFATPSTAPRGVSSARAIREVAPGTHGKRAADALGGEPKCRQEGGLEPAGAGGAGRGQRGLEVGPGAEPEGGAAEGRAEGVARDAFEGGA